MKRSKKVFSSALLVGACLTAGTAFMFANDSQAEEFDFGEITVETMASSISSELGLSQENVLESLNTKTIIVKANDVSQLNNNPNVASVKNIIGNYYSVEYNGALETAEGYKELSSADYIDSTMLNTILSTSRYKFTNGDSDKQSWGTTFMKMDTYADEIDSTCTTPLKVGVIDSGIRATHNIFTESSSQDRLSMADGYDYYNNDADPTDDHGHGTMVSGLISQSTPKCVKIIPVKVAGPDGNGSLLNIFYGVGHVAQKGARVANISMGASYSKFTPSDRASIDEIINEFESTYGILIVAAAGNETDSEVNYPAASDAVVAVTSIDSNKSLSYFSNYGSKADFAAPGGYMYVAENSSDNAYSQGMGTSFSSPFVAAAFANVFIEHSDFTNDQAYNYLRLNAEDLGTEGWDNKFGWGAISMHVNKYADLNMTISGVPTTWQNSNVNITASMTSTNYNIAKSKLVSGDSALPPASWDSDIVSDSATKTITKNGTYTIWAKNSNNEHVYKTIVVDKIDKAAPSLKKELKAVVADEENFTLSIEFNESASGISKVEWYYKAEEDTDYTKETDEYDEDAVATDVVKSHDFEVSEEGAYSAYAKIFDRAGNSIMTDVLDYVVSADGGTFGGGTISGGDDAGGDAGVGNPKTESSSIVKISVSAIVFAVAGIAVAIKRRR